MSAPTRLYPSLDSAYVCCFCGEVIKIGRIAYAHNKDVFHPWCAAECAKRQTTKLARVRSRLLLSRRAVIILKQRLENEMP